MMPYKCPTRFAVLEEPTTMFNPSRLEEMGKKKIGHLSYQTANWAFSRSMKIKTGNIFHNTSWKIRIFAFPFYEFITVIIVTGIILTIFGIFLMYFKCKGYKKK